MPELGFLQKGFFFFFPCVTQGYSPHSFLSGSVYMVLCEFFFTYLDMSFLQGKHWNLFAFFYIQKCSLTHHNVMNIVVLIYIYISSVQRCVNKCLGQQFGYMDRSSTLFWPQWSLNHIWSYTYRLHIYIHISKTNIYILNGKEEWSTFNEKKKAAK